MPAPLVELLGQRNALLFYAQRMQSALQATMQSMLYVGAAHNFMHNQLADARQADPIKREDNIDVFMPFSTWQQDHLPHDAFKQAAPCVAEYLADCFVPLDADCAYGLPVDKTICHHLPIASVLHFVQNATLPTETAPSSSTS